MNQTRLKIMPIGDSITQGFNSSDLRGYRTPLWNLAQLADWSIDFVGSLEDEAGDQSMGRHEGHYGWRIDHLYEHMKSCLQLHQPDVLLLHVGTNDILHGCSAVKAITRLEQLLDYIDSVLPDAKVFVAQITPLGFEALNTRVQKYNQLIFELTQKKAEAGRATQCVDMYSMVSMSTINDKIHTNNVGYVAMAQGWFQALEQWYMSFASPFVDVPLDALKQNEGAMV